MTLALRRGTDSERLTITPDLGEPIWTTDNHELWIGDGVTVGGILVTIADSEDFEGSDSLIISHIGQGRLRFDVPKLTVAAEERQILIGDSDDIVLIPDSVAGNEIGPNQLTSKRYVDNRTSTVDVGTDSLSITKVGNTQTFDVPSISVSGNNVTLGGDTDSVLLPRIKPVADIQDRELVTKSYVDNHGGSQTGIFNGHDTEFVYDDGTWRKPAGVTTFAVELYPGGVNDIVVHDTVFYIGVITYIFRNQPEHDSEYSFVIGSVSGTLDNLARTTFSSARETVRSSVTAGTGISPSAEDTGAIFRLTDATNTPTNDVNVLNVSIRSTRNIEEADGDHVAGWDTFAYSDDGRPITACRSQNFNTDAPAATKGAVRIYWPGSA